MEKRMQSLLIDIELDVQELKYLVQLISEESDQRLYEVTKRLATQMEERCRQLNEMLRHTTSSKQDSLSIEELSIYQKNRLTDNSFLSDEKDQPVEEGPLLQKGEQNEEDSSGTDKVRMSMVESFSFPDVKPILGDAIKKRTVLVGSLSLNDSFRYSQELFSGDLSFMNETLKKIEQEANSLEEALYIMKEISSIQEENEIVTDFLEWIQGFFDR